MATNFQSYEASSITCDNNTIQISGELQLENGSRLNGLPDPESNGEAVTLGYLQTEEQYAESDVNVGTIQIWFKTTIPTDYLLCNGQSFNTSTYPELFEVLGTNVLPDLRNQFIRGSNTSTVGEEVAESNVPIGEHAHSYDKYTELVTFTTDKIYAPLDTVKTYVSDIDSSYTSTLTSFVGSNTAQFYPAHITVHYIIKARSTRAFRNSIQNDSLPTASLVANIDRLFSNIQLDMNNNKIINLPQPVNDSDVATKFYVDQSIAGGGLINKLENGTQTLILQPTELQTTVNLNMESNKIINLANATLSSDALNLQTGDARYYLNTTPLQNLVAPTGELNMNSEKIINLANPTELTDAINLQTGDGRYYLNTTPIENLTLATNELNMNSEKISNMSAGTLFNDAVILEELEEWIYVRTDTPELANLSLYPTTFEESGQTSNLSFSFSEAEPTQIEINQSGINIRIKVELRASYSDRTKRIEVRLEGSVQGIIEEQPGLQPPANNENIDTPYEVVLMNVEEQTLSLIIIPTTTTTVTIQPGTMILIQRLY